MSVADDEPLHDFADRAIRESLRNPENLRSFVGEVLPKVASHCDFSRARYLPRDYLLDDWRGRECDLLVEIPFRVEGTERTILICILLEHQTRADARMPLRTLIYAVLYWERQWKAWEDSPAPREPLRLHPVVPIVMHTGARPWSAARSLIDLIDAPEVLRNFAPNWDPIFWELSAQDPQHLLNSGEAFLQVLAAIRLEEAERSEFELVFRETLQRIEEFRGRNNVLWSDLLRMLVTWASWRRPPSERKVWWEMAETIQTDADRERQLKEWRKIVMAELRAEFAQEMLIEMGTKRFGPPSAEVEKALLNVADSSRLKRMVPALLDVSSWEELLAIT